MSRTQNRGTMDIIREKRSYKYFITKSSKICNFKFHSLVPNCKNNSYKNGQNCCPFLFGENGRYSKSVTCIDKQGNLGILNGQRDYNYCRVPPSSPQHAVVNCEGFKQMEVKSSGVSKLLQVLVDFRHRPFCFQSFPSSCRLCSLETGSILQRQGCFQMCMTDKKGYAFTPFSLNCQPEVALALRQLNPIH